MKGITLSLVFALVSVVVMAQDVAKDQAKIKEMCGCFEVKFNFAEVYSPDLGYDLKKPYSSQATEYVALVEESDGHVSMQHVLQISPEMIIKHWRQDWNYEDGKLMQYAEGSSWKAKHVDNVAGTWTQSVYQVDDSPRYEGIGVWIHAEDGSYWEGKSDAPLPRRDLKSRDDYNVMNRRNRHTILPEGKGHLHEEDNTKIDRSTKYGDEVIAIEKGYNTYTRVDDSRCAAAKEWWANNDKFWSLVRAEWNKISDESEELNLDFEDGKNAEFYMAMFGLNDEHVGTEKFKKGKARKDIKALMAKYLIK